MATRNLARDPISGRSLSIAWSGLLNGDDGQPWDTEDFPDWSVQITGTFGAGGTVVIQGSNNGTNWITLRDPSGAILSFTAADLRQALELSRWVRPAVTAGDGTTSLVATIKARRRH
jgi:hypothetical protein